VVQASGLLPLQAGSLHHNGFFEDRADFISLTGEGFIYLMLRLPEKDVARPSWKGGFKGYREHGDKRKIRVAATALRSRL
jgi:hypothetical protein